MRKNQILKIAGIGIITSILLCSSSLAQTIPGPRLISTQASPPAAQTQPGPSIALQKIKIMNYYPSLYSWGAMWTYWHPEIINNDFASIASSLHANTVRIILQASVIGYPAPSTVMLEHLNDIVTMAAAHNMRVQLTLFDMWSNFEDVAGSKQWAQAVLAPYAHDKRIAFVELKNEIVPTNATVMAWAQVMLPFVQSISGGIPVTPILSFYSPPLFLHNLNTQAFEPLYTAYPFISPFIKVRGMWGIKGV